MSETTVAVALGAAVGCNGPKANTDRFPSGKWRSPSWTAVDRNSASMPMLCPFVWVAVALRGGRGSQLDYLGQWRHRRPQWRSPSGTAVDRNLEDWAQLVRALSLAVALRAAVGRNCVLACECFTQLTVAVALRGGRGSQPQGHARGRYPL
ncbi:hypothetical protein [Microbispora hainanensis]|uniref:hypothetical protein n=1 Tax=Microbispora hainanensis TaxID=568844 RepID=UPI003F53E93A